MPKRRHRIKHKPQVIAATERLIEILEQHAGNWHSTHQVLCYFKYSMQSTDLWHKYLLALGSHHYQYIDPVNTLETMVNIVDEDRHLNWIDLNRRAYVNRLVGIISNIPRLTLIGLHTDERKLDSICNEMVIAICTTNSILTYFRDSEYDLFKLDNEYIISSPKLGGRCLIKEVKSATMMLADTEFAYLLE